MTMADWEERFEWIFETFGIRKFYKMLAKVSAEIAKAPPKLNLKNMHEFKDRVLNLILIVRYEEDVRRKGEKVGGENGN